MSEPTYGPRYAVAPDGTQYRDLDHTGVMEPWKDPRLTPAERAANLLPRLSLEEKVGLMFHTVIEAGEDGNPIETAGAISKSPTSVVIGEKHLNHFNVHKLGSARLAARWHNAVQAIAEKTPHGIPVTISTDPRHAFMENAGASFSAGSFSQWPEGLGMAALRDPQAVEEFADVARAEYVAVGIRAALHPTVDLATEPRWARQAQTFGQDPKLTTELGVAYLRGFQGETLGAASVACTAKHFPGGGPQKDGEDAHFPYGREQVYPAGQGEAHMQPFPALIGAGVSAIMPYYGMPIGLALRGIELPEVGFGYSKECVTDLLRGELGYDGVVLSDWELVNDNHVGDQVLPARAWGVEHLDPAGRMEMILNAGCDQFGGEECVEVLLQLVADGRVSEERIDESATRLLKVKFQLGLFDNPYVSEEAAQEIVGNPDFVAKGRRAQSRSVTILQGAKALPLTAGQKVYAEGIGDKSALAGFECVDDPHDADVILVRVGAPFEPRSDLFLEAWFHQGHLEFQPGFIERMKRLAAHAPVILDVTLDRPAILTPFVDVATVLTGSFGTSDVAYMDALTGREPAQGALPFDLPRSMEQVRSHDVDAPGYDDPLFAFGHGERLA